MSVCECSASDFLRSHSSFASHEHRSWQYITIRHTNTDQPVTTNTWIYTDTDPNPTMIKSHLSFTPSSWYWLNNASSHCSWALVDIDLSMRHYLYWSGWDSVTPLCWSTIRFVWFTSLVKPDVELVFKQERALGVPDVTDRCIMFAVLKFFAQCVLFSVTNFWPESEMCHSHSQVYATSFM